MAENDSDFTPEDDGAGALLKKWTLILGLDPGTSEDSGDVEWTGDERRIHNALKWVYDQDGQGAGKNRNIQVREWMEDINTYFPTPVSVVLQKDALSRFGLELLLHDDTFIDNIIPDVQLAASIIHMKGILPDTARQKANLIIAKIVDQLTEKLVFASSHAIGRALRSPLPNRKPRLHQVHWPRTILKNLSTYQDKTRTIIPEKLSGKQHRKKTIDTIYILVDQSGSMAESMVYAAIYGAIFASIPAITTHFALFDTEIADMTHLVYDPVELLFTTQLGGGTDIGKALQYAMQTSSNPDRSLLILISDLDETESNSRFHRAAEQAEAAFNKMLVILALNDQGHAIYNKDNARHLTNLDIQCVAATPKEFPELVANKILLSRS